MGKRGSQTNNGEVQNRERESKGERSQEYLKGQSFWGAKKKAQKNYVNTNKWYFKWERKYNLYRETEKE